MVKSENFRFYKLLFSKIITFAKVIRNVHIIKMSDKKQVSKKKIEVRITALKSIR